MVTDAFSFRLTNTPKIIFGPGTLNNLSMLIELYGSRILLITGNKSYNRPIIGDKVERVLGKREISYQRFIVSREPSPELIDEAVIQFGTWNPQLIVAVGGGSVLDAGKAISAMMLEEGNVSNYLEEVGTRAPSGKRLPMIAIPTTSGTGSEATKNAVISRMGKEGYKKSLRHDNYVPDYAIVDPELIVECPSEITAASGMDAFTQLLESYLSTQASPITDALAISGLQCIARSLLRVFMNGNDISARTDLAYAALLSGITLANAGLGLVHGFAQPLGCLFPVPHGVVCGTLMGATNRLTVDKLRAADLDSIALKKYALAGKLFAEDYSKKDDDNIDYLLDIIDQFTERFSIPRLSNFGISNNDLELIAMQTGLKNHPVQLNMSDRIGILKKRL